MGPNPVLVWSPWRDDGDDRIHIHFGQGTFEGPKPARPGAGNADYRLLTRHPQHGTRPSPGACRPAVHPD